MNSTVASPARMYAYYLGGKDNVAADREATDQVIVIHLEQRELAWQDRVPRPRGQAPR